MSSDLGTAAALAVLLALVAAVAYPGANALQQKAHLRDLHREPEAGAASATVGILRQPIWWLGSTVGLAGVLSQAAASALAPLVLVAPVLALQLVFLVPASAWVVKSRMARRDWLAAALTTTGMAVALLALRPNSGVELGRGADWLVAGAVCAACFVTLWVLSIPAGPYRTALRGAAAGVHAGFVGALVKQIVEEPELTNWAVWAMSVLGAMNAVWINAALRAGRLSTAMTMMVVSGTVVGSGIGIYAFDETITLSPTVAVVATAALGVVAAGIVLLASSPSLLALEEETATTEEATARREASSHPVS
jgi:hypothetical protein